MKSICTTIAPLSRKPGFAWRAVGFLLIAGHLSVSYAGGYPAATASYPAPWIAYQTFDNNTNTDVCATSSLGGVEGCTAGYSASQQYPRVGVPWFSAGLSACQSVGYVLTSCYEAGFQHPAGSGNLYFLVGQACIYSGAVDASYMNTSWGDSYAGWCLVRYTGQALPSGLSCSGVYNLQDPTIPQCFASADKNSEPTCHCSGDPINPGSGNVFEGVTDYKGGGSFPLVLTRTYSSSMAALGSRSNGEDNSVGVGWTPNVAAHLFIYISPVQTFTVCSDTSPTTHSGGTNHDYGVQYICPVVISNIPGSVMVWHGDGSQETFTGTFTQGIPSSATFTPEQGSKGQLTYNGGGYTYLRADGYTETYDGSGKLVSVQDPHGLTQTYAYSFTFSGATALLYLRTLTVTDPAGRQMVLNYDNTPGDANVGRVTSVTLPSNTATTGTGTITYGYGTSGNLQTVTYQDGKALTYEYNDSALPHALTGLKDEDGNEFSAWSYNDATGNAVCSEHAPSGNTPSTATTCSADMGGIGKVTLAYNSDGSVDVTEATGLVRHLTFANINGTAQLASATEPCVDCSDKAASISYDSNGYVSSVTDFNGVVTNYTHDTAGRETSRTEAAGTADQRTTTTTWNAIAGLPQEIDEDGYNSSTPARKTVYCYNLSGGACNDGTSVGSVWTKSILDPVNGFTRTTTYTYSGGLLASVTGPRTDLTQTTNYTYTSGSLSKLTNPLNQATQITSYTASGLPLTVVDPNNVTTTLAYDARSRLLSKEVNDTGHVTTYAYDFAGNLTQVTKPNGVYLKYRYDVTHRLTVVTDTLGDTINYTLDGLDNRTDEQVKDPAGNLTKRHQRVYNDLDELTQDIGGMGQTTTYSNFDGDGHARAITDPLSNATQRTFDALGRLASVTDANNGYTTYLYDALDGLQYVTDPRTLTTQYTRDAYGEVLQLVSPDTGTTNYTYDGAGDLKTKQDAVATWTYTYDALNRATGRTTGDTVSALTYTYDQGTDGIGHLTASSAGSGTGSANSTSYTYNGFGNLTKKTETVGTVSIAVTYGYDTDHNLVQIQLSPQGSVTYDEGVNYSLDAMGRISGVTTQYLDAASGLAWTTPVTVASGVGYEPFGPLDGLTYGNGFIETRSYDTDYRVTGISIPGVEGLGYTTYDADDNIKIVTDSVDANGQSFAQTLGYDVLNRVTSVNGMSAFTYQYDADGNRSQLTNTGSGAVTTYAIAGTSNQLQSATTNTSTATYSFNTRGDVTSDGINTFGYGNDERIDSVTNTGAGATYIYDAFGQRVSKTVGAVTTLFVYDEQGHLLAELNGSNTLSATHVWLGDRPLAYYSGGTDVALDYIHTDNLDTPRIMTNGAGVIGWLWQSDPFGNGQPTVINFGSNFNLRFPGQYYDAETGHNYNWMRDYDSSIGRYIESDPIGLKAGINTYVYAIGNPVDFIDRSGLSTAVANRSTGTLTVSFNDGSTVTYPMGNNTVNPSGDPNTVNSNGPAPMGTFPVQPPINTGNSVSYGPFFFPIGATNPDGTPADIARQRGIGIHGGRRNHNSRTEGCLRLDNADITDLFNRTVTDPLTSITIE